VLSPLVVADLMRGTGRYNLALGAIATVHGIGASASGLVMGEIVDHFGYTVAFLALAAVAAVALTVLAIAMRETAIQNSVADPGDKENHHPCRYLPVKNA
jgi:hypothetical protein